MKTYHINSIAIILLIVSGCKKENITNPSPDLAALQIIHAAKEYRGNSITLNMFGNDADLSKFTDGAYYQSSKSYAIKPGNTSITIFEKTAPFNILLKKDIMLNSSKMYSLFVAGNEPEALFVEENSIPRFQDSTIAVRVVNLIKNGPSISINLAMTPQTKEFESISNRSISSFKQYNFNLEHQLSGQYQFEFRNSMNNELLTSYSLPSGQWDYPSPASIRFKAVTMILSDDAWTEGYSAFIIVN